ncbi:MAG: TonB-dependent receptor [Burkholderiaceae bacterium]
MKKALPPGRQRRIALKPVAAACAATLSLLAQNSHAQQAAPAPASAPSSAAPTPTASDTTVVTVVGIRGSLETSANLKRESHGVVDGIVAEDIGKFPDTNLAESMQRIAGVSIDRAPNGEGQKITVRGMGPEYNMILLNGRQMPTGIISDENGGANGSRAFDFSNLSADSISAIEVYKTSRASLASGGIGATVNVKTARPLDIGRRVAAVSVKANYDNSESRLPSSFQSSKVTPDVSGIYSDTFADGTFGVSISGSYSKRNSGYDKAYTQGGWRTFPAADHSDWGSIPAAPVGAPDPVTNRPTTGAYSTSVDMRYSLTAVERERTNGQLTLQWAPSKNLTFTADETLASNIQHKKNAELSSWFNFSFGGAGVGGYAPLTFTGGPVATPIIETALFPNNDHDLAVNAGAYGQKTTLNSTGFNADWKASDALRFNLDAHHSTSLSKPDSPYGSYSTMDLGMFGQGTATAYYDKKLPILNLGTTAFDINKLELEGSQFVNNLSDQTVDQLQTGGVWKLGMDDTLNVGLGFTRTKNRSAGYTNQNNDWGGVGAQGDYTNVPISVSSLPGYFGQIPGHNDSRLLQNYYMADFNALHATGIQVAMANGTPGHPAPLTAAEAAAYFSASSDYSKGNDWRTTEKSSSLYGQWDHFFDTSMPQNLSVGLRYEHTGVNSSSQVVSRINPSWNSQNEVGLAAGPTNFGSAKGKYSYFLPNLDWDADLTSNVKVRASFGETIGRPGWDKLLGGTSLGSSANTGGGTGTAGNPNLKPMLSKNLDLSAEWYYTKSSYVSVGAFYKRIANLVTTSVVNVTMPGLNTPIGGAYYQAGLAACGAGAQPLCIRNFIFNNFAGAPGVTVGATNANGEILGSIAAQPADPALTFQVTTPSNGPSDNLKGLELTAQHMFGHSGFGLSGNFTWVRTGLKYDNTNLTTQTALLGVSNSANLVGFYEDDTWSVRAAYNWRDTFLAATTDGAGNNPVYTEPYGQLDLSIGYKIGKHLSLQADLLNLNDGYLRQHGRAQEQLVSAIQTGRRYLVGGRYQF